MAGLITKGARRNEFNTLTNRLFDNWFNEINDIFAFDTSVGIFDTHSSNLGYPRVNIIDQEKEVIIEASVPGLTKDDVQVEWCDNTLTISGGKEEKKESNDKDYKRREITKRKFSRSFSVYHSQFECYNIEAEVKDGLLTIKLPKKPQSKEPEPHVVKFEVK